MINVKLSCDANEKYPDPKALAPASVGVPLMTPEDDIDRPAGRSPPIRAYWAAYAAVSWIVVGSSFWRDAMGLVVVHDGMRSAVAVNALYAVAAAVVPRASKVNANVPYVVRAPVSEPFDPRARLAGSAPVAASRVG